jgi:hypothetical protein
MKGASPYEARHADADSVASGTALGVSVCAALSRSSDAPFRNRQRSEWRQHTHRIRNFARCLNTALTALSCRSHRQRLVETARELLPHASSLRLAAFPAKRFVATHSA